MPYYVRSVKDLIVSLPFRGNTNYQSIFVPVDLNCKNRRFPDLQVQSDPAFNTKSTYQDMMKVYKISKPKRNSRKNEKLCSFNFPGQFLSETRKSFTGKIPSSPTQLLRVKDHNIL